MIYERRLPCAIKHMFQPQATRRQSPALVFPGGGIGNSLPDVLCG
jgi:hypothetical protein